MRITNIVNKGALKYSHYSTIDSIDVCYLDCPRDLAEIADKYPSSKGVIFSDGKLGITIDGKVEYMERPFARQSMTELGYSSTPVDRTVWQYINLAMGRNGNTQSMRL